MSGAPGAGVHPAAAIAEETVGLINKGKNAAESAAYDVSGEDGPGGSR
jgi:hypothetical protein